METKRDLAALKARAKARAKERAEEDKRYLQEHLPVVLRTLTCSLQNKEGVAEKPEDIIRATKETLQQADEERKNKAKQRKQQLAQASKALREKVPVSLTPVVVHKEVTKKESTETMLQSCSFCGQVLNNEAVTSKCTIGHIKLYHSSCWQKLCNTTDNNGVQFLGRALAEFLPCAEKCRVLRLYYYEGHKLVEKVAIKEQTKSVEETVLKAEIPVLESTFISEQVKPIASSYHGPSWRSIDVSAYEKHKAQKQKQKKEKKTGKVFLDIGKQGEKPLTTTEGDTIEELEKSGLINKEEYERRLAVLAGNTVKESENEKEYKNSWREKQVPENVSGWDETAMHLGVERPKENPLITFTKEESLKIRDVPLDPTVSEFVPRVLPPSVPFCAHCKVALATMISYPCRHLANCLSCTRRLRTCGICVRKK